MIKRFLTAAAAVAAVCAPLALALGSSAAQASIIGDPGVYLSSTPSLTLAAPNVVTAGKSAELKTCLSVVPGNCAALANDKTTETFDFVLSTNVFHPGTYEIVLHGTSWCLTTRSAVAPAAVFFEPCQQFASQLFDSTSGVITSAKTDLNLAPTSRQAYAPLEANNSFTHWSLSS